MKDIIKEISLHHWLHGETLQPSHIPASFSYSAHTLPKKKKGSIKLYTLWLFTDPLSHYQNPRPCGRGLLEFSVDFTEFICKAFVNLFVKYDLGSFQSGRFGLNKEFNLLKINNKPHEFVHTHPFPPRKHYEHSSSALLLSMFLGKVQPHPF